ncbi:hypothetical protein AT15_00220 [Kosmotoga arenicorallina S304]|uniref:Uncharacterized protein n=1 Tax=Kosmotoga arenicorallina S304 TaxID=1453497 RepID=A0A176K3V8_9BACT|nr:hypothetical protein [Kosmotoga arenicorallina]OAA32535.1 hypothetical protein AT15_00220 [Kosmotoga arenicorallina S304]
MKKLLVVSLLVVVTMAFGGYFIGIGDAGNAYGIAAGMTLEDLSLFGYNGHGTLMAVLGTGVGAALDLTPFELFSGVFGDNEYHLLIGAGAGGSFGFLLSGGFNIGAGVTLKVLWGEHFLSKTTVGFGLGGFYSDSALAYVF